jgi:hypothetical protein
MIGLTKCSLRLKRDLVSRGILVRVREEWSELKERKKCLLDAVRVRPASYIVRTNSSVEDCENLEDRQHPLTDL